MDELQAQVRDELAAITDVLEDILGRRSRWNGEVELSDDATMFGKASWSGRIVINRNLAISAARWRTEIHELLHTFSPRLTVSDYMDLPGWEEGVVEKMQRQLRQGILARLSVSVPEAVFAAVEAKHEYNVYIAALDNLISALNEPPAPIYQELLALPLKERPPFIIRQGRQIPTDLFHRFQREFALAHSTLRGD